MLLAKQIAFWADTLRDISALGLQYSDSIYDKERYSKIQQMAVEMLAFATGKSLGDLEPLRETIFSRPGPIVGCDGAVIDDNGRILLIHRSDNKKWVMPGGLLEVGETPAEGALREVYEETGVRCDVISLVGIFNSRFCGTTYPLHLYHILFLCKPLDSRKKSKPSHSQESLDLSWFDEHSLPLDIDPGHISRISDAFRNWRGDLQIYFDK
jgi:8-oxo-dGTP pyrophosphatase MutT (NUDIX family)